MKTFIISIKLTLTFCLLLGIGYVLVLWGVAQVATPNSGAVVPVENGERIVGADNVGQTFTSAEYFWGRPSASEYDARRSGGSNMAVSNTKYLAEVETRINLFLQAHPYLERSQVPAEMVTASGSGLDPHISVAAAEAQAQRIAEARGVEIEAVKTIIVENTQKPLVGIAVVNVLNINIALDKKLK